VEPIALALSMGATFAARAVDIDQANLRDILERAAKHKGTSLVEVYQNCHVFNDGTFDAVANKKTRDDHRVMLEHGKPLVFGKDRDKGIRLNGLDPEVVSLTGGQYTEADLLVHDEKSDQTVLAYFLSRMQYPDFPVPMGVFRAADESCYGEALRSYEDRVRGERGPGDWEQLIHSGESWVVE
jgi:2-oxoglutarate ferredoxin oxidoreductase subunit beta